MCNAAMEEGNPHKYPKIPIKRSADKERGAGIKGENHRLQFCEPDDG